MKIVHYHAGDRYNEEDNNHKGDDDDDDEDFDDGDDVDVEKGAKASCYWIQCFSATIKIIISDDFYTSLGFLQRFRMA